MALSYSVSDKGTYRAVRGQLNTNDDNDGCNINHDGNFDDHDDKITKKLTNIKSFG